MIATTLQEVPLKNRLLEKLHPNRFPRMSGLMSAIVGHVLDAAFTQPSIAEIVVTSDGFVLARAEGEIGANHFIGTYRDLLRNWFSLLAAAGLTTIERLEAEALFAAKIGYFGRLTA
jgi:hypothetical protein